MSQAAYKVVTFVHLVWHMPKTTDINYIEAKNEVRIFIFNRHHLKKDHVHEMNIKSIYSIEIFALW